MWRAGAARRRLVRPVHHTVDNYVTLTDRAATAHARRNQRLVVGPWTHADQTGTAELFFGRGADAAAIGLERQQLEFLRRVVAGDDAPNGPRVRIFVMSHNVWRDEEAWPLARTRYTPWYLHAGTLSPEEPASTARPSTYTYDPRDPVPTVGGQTLMSGGSDGGQVWQPGPRDQRVLDGRTDVLTFTSEVLAEDVEVTGHVTVTLSASTSVTDTDFTAKLIDVWLDGRAMGVVDGGVASLSARVAHAKRERCPQRLTSNCVSSATTSSGNLAIFDLYPFRTVLPGFPHGPRHFFGGRATTRWCCRRRPLERRGACLLLPAAQGVHPVRNCRRRR